MIIVRILLWPIFIFLVFIPLLIIGWVMVPLAAICRAYEKTDDNLDKPADGPIYQFTWPIMFVWGNYEDGIANRNYKQFDSMFMQIVYWSCIRNPVNNLRVMPILSCKIEPKRVEFIGSFGHLHGNSMSKNLTETIKSYDTKIPQWFFAWHGLYSNFYWQFNLFGKLRRIWVGWKIYPTDIYGVTKYRESGAGFAQQFKVVK